MLRWQLKKWFNNCSLKTKITCVSIFGHLCVLFLLLVLYRGNEQYHILITGSMINTDVPIVFLPMFKSLRQPSGNGNSSSTSSSVSKNSEAQVAITVKKNTIAAVLPEAKSKKNAKKKKATEAKKNRSKNIEEKKAVKSEKKVAEKTKPVEQPVEIPQQQVQTSENITPNTAPIEDGNQNVLYVGQQEMDALQMQDYIQQEIAQHWSPPTGMRKNISCIIKVLIGFDGTISTIDIEQPSGVLIFDGAAKRAACQLTPPQWACGKEIVLTFKP